jgi:hypothetical protein
VQSLSFVEQRLLFFRTGQSSLFNICSDHVEKYIKTYTFRTNQKFCCDPYVKHKKRVNCELVVSIDLSDELFELSGMRIIPGKKLCRRCDMELRKGKKLSLEDDLESFPEAVGELSTEKNTFDINRNASEDFSPSAVFLQGESFCEYFPEEQSRDLERNSIPSNTGHSSDLQPLELESDDQPTTGILYI